MVVHSSWAGVSEGMPHAQEIFFRIRREGSGQLHVQAVSHQCGPIMFQYLVTWHIASPFEYQ